MNREIFDRLEQGSAARAANLMSAREVYRSRAITAEPISLAAESRRGFNPLTKLALLLTALAAPAVALLHDARPVSADKLVKPAIFTGEDGNEFTVAALEEGEVLVFTSETGMRIANGSDASGGIVRGGKVKAAVGALDRVNARVTALNCGGLFIDVLGKIEGNGYMELAPNTMDILNKEMNRVSPQEKEEYSILGIIGGQDTVFNQWFDEIGGSKDRGVSPEPQVCGAPNVPVAPSTPVEQQVPIEACVGSSEAIAVPSSHGAIPVANLDANTPRKTWIRPVYAPLKADAAHNWEGIGPWAPIAVAFEPGVAHLKTFGNVGEFVIAGDAGGTVSVSFMQQRQHWQDALRRPDGALDSAWQLQYTIDGLPAGAAVTPFDPDTGEQLKWPDGTPIQWAAGPLGTFSVGLPRDAEVRFGVRFCLPGQQPGVQNPEVKVRRGPNDQPGLTGENQLPNTPQVVKAGMPD